MKKTLVLGASGATGSLLVRQLLENNFNVVAILRPASSLMPLVAAQPNYQEIKAEISETDAETLAEYVVDCEVVFSCLGHNLTLKGIFGNPRNLVTESVTKLSRAIELSKPDHKLKFILMNTTGNANRDIAEKPPWSQRLVIALIRLLIPPHADNEKAADYLRLTIGQNHPVIEWAAVRPDGLIDENEVTSYEVLESPSRNVIFNAGSTSRLNVANFMARLAIEEKLWKKWRGKMPVIYNSDQS